MTQDEYKVELEVFEGPLDLLLYLIKKDEIDIYNIPIEKITSKYMEYLNVMRMLDLNIAGEFIVMAATLMMIKSRMLLPVEDRTEIEEEEEDPRWDLVRQLVEYKKFKDAALALQDKELHQENVFGMGGEDNIAVENDDPGTSLLDIGLFDLIACFNDVLKRAKDDVIGVIESDKYTVGDKIDTILMLINEHTEVPFNRLFGANAHRHEIICTFLALLELIRLRHVIVRQNRAFGEIVIAGIVSGVNAEPIDVGGDQLAPEMV
ncbi:MAG: segregation/condensation protein A [Lentisphaerae bacterium]|nr:segregation/condensation protein A [Lentisphaerota bacterium]